MVNGVMYHLYQIKHALSDKRQNKKVPQESKTPLVYTDCQHHLCLHITECFVQMNNQNPEIFHITAA